MSALSSARIRWLPPVPSGRVRTAPPATGRDATRSRPNPNPPRGPGEKQLRAYRRHILPARWPNAPCAQFARHLSLWVPVQTFEEWGIGYTRLVQRPGELVVTAPGAYHEGWNNGANVAEAVNFGDGKTRARARRYTACYWGCFPDDGVWDYSRRKIKRKPANAPPQVELRFVEAEDKDAVAKAKATTKGEDGSAGEDGGESEEGDAGDEVDEDGEEEAADS